MREKQIQTQTQQREDWSSREAQRAQHSMVSALTTILPTMFVLDTAVTLVTEQQSSPAPTSSVF